MHYENGKGYDVIDFITDYGLNFNKGNIIKYVARAGKKGDEISDLRKALDYINREIETIEKQKKQWVESHN
jgi:Cdc6-like AAA superfamily ATPase